MKRLLLLLAATGILATGCENTTSEPAEGPAVAIDVTRYDVPRLPDDQVIGAKSPLVTLVLFSDYACEPCGRAWKVAQDLVEHYPDDLAVVYRSFNVPGYSSGEIAAEAALAAGAQGKFWEMHRALFANGDNFSRPSLRLDAEKLGLDVARFFADIDESVGTGTRIRHQRQAALLGIRALPVGFVNGLFLMGSPLLNEPSMRALVEAEIKQARRLMQDGTPRQEVYAGFMRGALRKAVTETEEAEALREARAAQAPAGDPLDAPRKGPDRSARYDVPLGAPGRGPADAPVVAVEFVDFMCPFCRRAEGEVLDALFESFGDDLRLEVRQMPLPMHEGADAAARAYLAAARQGKHLEFGRELFGERSVGLETFRRLARQAGLDVARFERDFKDPALGKQVESDLALARQLGVSGTPAMFINGRFVDGLQSVGAYAGFVREDLARAKELLEQGVPREQLHARLMTDALPSSQFPNPAVAEDGAGNSADAKASPVGRAAPAAVDDNSSNKPSK